MTLRRVSRRCLSVSSCLCICSLGLLIGLHSTEEVLHIDVLLPEQFETLSQQSCIVGRPKRLKQRLHGSAVRCRPLFDSCSLLHEFVDVPVKWISSIKRMGNSCFIVELGCFSSSESVSYIQFANYRLCRWKWISWTLKPSGGQFIFNGLRQLAGLGLIFLLQRFGGGFNGI